MQNTTVSTPYDSNPQTTNIQLGYPQFSSTLEPTDTQDNTNANQPTMNPTNVDTTASDDKVSMICMQARIATLEQENKDLNNRLKNQDELQARITTLEQENQELSNRLRNQTELQARLAELEQQTLALNQSLASKSQENETLRQQYQALQQQQQQQQQQSLQSDQDRIVRLEQEKRDLQRKIDVLNTQIEGSARDVQKITNENANLKATIQTKDQEIATLKQNIKDRDSNIVTLQNQIQTLNQVIMDQNQQISKLQEEIARLERRIRILENR